jgi:hypothetical protein
MAAEQAKARKPTKNEQRRARKKQAKAEVRFHFHACSNQSILTVF